jgi:mono/diheme cytochrome c family protein
MKTQRVLILGFILLVGVLLASNEGSSTSVYEITTAEKTKDEANTSFDTMMRVLTHQRCVNCHPNDNIPKQGDDSHPHYFGIRRGMDKESSAATQCITCHQSENNSYSGVPGAPEWALAPASMYWEGLSKIEIAESMMDPERNGGRTPEETMHHLTEHELVLWAWEPGVNANGVPREVPPVPKEEYIAAVKKWFKEGHSIPSK